VEPGIAILSSLPAWQRVVVVGLAIIPLILVTVCCAPALIVLPFVPGGVKAAEALISKLISWTKIILIGSQALSG
jgi:hypothetical protein